MAASAEGGLFWAGTPASEPPGAPRWPGPQPVDVREPMEPTTAPVPGGGLAGRAPGPPEEPRGAAAATGGRVAGGGAASRELRGAAGLPPGTVEPEETSVAAASESSNVWAGTPACKPRGALDGHNVHVSATMTCLCIFARRERCLTESHWIE